MSQRTAVLIDDERLARVELRRLLEAHPQIQIVGEASNGMEGIALVEAHGPDLVFLDIQMPGMSGFEMLSNLDAAPEVIFTTAYDEFALQAFEISALDYLLKPISPVRLAKALGKLPMKSAEPLRHLFVKEGEHCWFVRPEELILLEAEGNYTRLYFAKAGAKRPLILRTLQSFADSLSPAQFFRASRKHLINLNEIEAVALAPNDGLQVTLRGGFAVPLSRRQSGLFRKLGGQGE